PPADVDRAVWQMIELETRDGAAVETRLVETGEGVEVGEDVARYDEWDYVIGLARPAWCTVRERPARLWPAELVGETTRRHTVNGERARLDLDACVDATVELRAGRTPSPRVHQRRGWRRHDLAVLLLLDLSRSVAERRHGTDATVLALARDATAIVAEA